MRQPIAREIQTLERNLAEVEECPKFVASQTEATPEEVELVINAEEPHERSKWMFVRLANGDLILGTYPRCEVYEEISETEGMV